MYIPPTDSFYLSKISTRPQPHVPVCPPLHAHEKRSSNRSAATPFDPQTVFAALTLLVAAEEPGKETF